MPNYEYRVIPAPSKGRKAKGIKTPEERFSLSVEDVLNRMGVEGWEYQRAELLPSTERSGLTGSATNWRNVLVFRRLLADQPPDTDQERLVLAAPVPVQFDDEVAPVENQTDPMLKPVPGPDTTEFGDAPSVNGASRQDNAEPLRTPPRIAVEPAPGEIFPASDAGAMETASDDNDNDNDDDKDDDNDDADLTGIERALLRNIRNRPD